MNTPKSQCKQSVTYSPVSTVLLMLSTTLLASCSSDPDQRSEPPSTDPAHDTSEEAGAPEEPPVPSEAAPAASALLDDLQTLNTWPESDREKARVRVTSVQMSHGFGPDSSGTMVVTYQALAKGDAVATAFVRPQSIRDENGREYIDEFDDKMIPDPASLVYDLMKNKVGSLESKQAKLIKRHNMRSGEGPETLTISGEIWIGRATTVHSKTISLEGQSWPIAVTDYAEIEFVKHADFNGNILLKEDVWSLNLSGLVLEMIVRNDDSGTQQSTREMSKSGRSGSGEVNFKYTWSKREFREAPPQSLVVRWIDGIEWEKERFEIVIARL